ncbi:MAG: hypothetical protein M9887_02555 [Chitinophagales bacterium]|nr:hypothetical protein [Chitinophagales bacterium]
MSFFIVNGQEIQTSAPIKLSTKAESFSILGKNENGIFVHYYGNSKDELELFNEQLRSVIKREVKLKDRNTKVEEIFLRNEGVVVFYSQVVENRQYLKAAYLNAQLQTTQNLVLDSLENTKVNSFEPYYIKQSPNLHFFTFFKIYKSSDEIQIKYQILDTLLNAVHSGDFNIQDKGLVLKSFKINNNGVIYAVIARESKSVVNDYIYDKIHTFLYNPKNGYVEDRNFEENESLFKNIVSQIDGYTDKAYSVFNYRNKKNTDDIGHIIIASNKGDEDYFRFPYTEEYMNNIQSIDVKNWKEKALLIRPQQIIPQSNGGCLILTEAQYKYTRVVRQANPYGYGYGYGYYNYYNDAYSRQYDQHHFFDVLGVSLNADGTINWSVDIPKAQITEDDEGLYSSFIVFQTNNLLKVLFNENVYSNGNLIEYNLNPNGQMKRRILVNTEKGGYTLIPRMAVQISKNEILIPAEQKHSLQLFLLKY